MVTVSYCFSNCGVSTGLLDTFQDYFTFHIIHFCYLGTASSFSWTAVNWELFLFSNSVTEYRLTFLMPGWTNSPSQFSLTPSDTEESFGPMMMVIPHCGLHEHVCNWLSLKILSVCPAFHEGWQTHTSAWCCLQHARARIAGMISKLGRLKGSSPPPLPVQHQIHSKWAFPTPPLIFLIQDQLYPVPAILSMEGSWVLTFQVKRQSSSPVLYCSELLCKAHKITHNHRIS